MRIASRLAQASLALACLSLGACGMRPPSHAQREAAAFDSLSGANPRAPGPRGIVSSFPPGDTSFDRLRCRALGPETVCTRDR